MPDVVLPVLDEADAIPWVLGRMPPGYRPIVVDNGSTDGSPEIAASLGARVLHEPRRGFGAACWTGLSASAGGVVCFMDCDGSLDPAALPHLVGPVERGEADLVVGERRPEPGAWPLHARLANRALARYLRRRHGVPLGDPGPMRAGRRDDLAGLGIEDRGFGWPAEMLARAGAAGWRVRGVPVAYLRRSGRSKVTGTVGGTIRAVRDTRAALRSVRAPRPGHRPAVRP